MATDSNARGLGTAGAKDNDEIASVAHALSLEALTIATRALVAVVVEPAKGRRLAIADAADRRLRPLLVRALEEAAAMAMLSTLGGPR